MADDTERRSLRPAGYSARRATVLLGVGVVLALFVGMGYWSTSAG